MAMPCQSQARFLGEASASGRSFLHGLPLKMGTSQTTIHPMRHAVHHAPCQSWSWTCTSMTGGRSVRMSHVTRCDPGWNPQNVPDPLVMPSTSFTPEQTVKAQLDALKMNDEPWSNHGIQTMYEFAEDAGGMERSRYFGFSKDLYHFDHFLGMFWNQFGGLVGHQGYQVLGQEQLPDGMVSVDVQVTSSKGDEEGVFRFNLVQHEFGKKKGCWMTKSLTKRA